MAHADRMILSVENDTGGTMLGLCAVVASQSGSLEHLVGDVSASGNKVTVSILENKGSLTLGAFSITATC